MKEGTGFYWCAAIFLALIIIAGVYIKLTDVAEAIDTNSKLENDFKNVDFGTGADYTIVWVHRFDPPIRRYYETDWYYWTNAIIYNNDEPYRNNYVELWWNIETDQTKIIEGLP